MPRLIITDEKKKEAVILYVEEVKPIREICAFLKCSYPTATRILRAEGVTIRPRGRVSEKPKATALVKPEAPVVQPTESGLSSAVEEARSRILNTYKTRQTERYTANG